MCKILGCRNYSGKYSEQLCKYHIHRFALLAVMREELWKHKNIAKPVHNRIVHHVKY